MRRRRTGAALLTGAFAVFLAGPAWGQGESAARAQALFDEGRALLEGGHFAEACPKLAESQALDPGGGTLLNLALCHEKEGKLGSAWSEFQESLLQAQREQRKDREPIARAHLAGLLGRVPHLTVTVPPSSEAPGLEVRLDGAVLGRAAWGAAQGIDSGVHRVDVAAPGHAPMVMVVTVRGEGDDVRLEVPKLSAATSPQTAPGTEAPTARVLVRPMSAGDTPPGRHPLFWPAVVVAGVGYGAAAVTGVLALSANGNAKDGCHPARDFCTPDGADAGDRARTLAWVSTGALGVAVVATVTALVLPKRTGSSLPEMTAEPVAGGAKGSVVLRF